MTLEDYSYWLFEAFVYQQLEYDIFRVHHIDGERVLVPFKFKFNEEHFGEIIISTVAAQNDGPHFNTIKHQQYLIQPPICGKDIFFILQLFVFERDGYIEVEGFMDKDTELNKFRFTGEDFDQYQKFKLVLH